eukprot:TRINITY_DN4786_c0_g1_i2.p1 TRINITY_DN4786_c0_g1~~TRINITY_DN4786_c0_g1_i2.p1  ORF type:complete len:309 (+),score=15.07 TRINITY_DN4786_c0_g1_i2:746-1672(+)
MWQLLLPLFLVFGDCCDYQGVAIACASKTNACDYANCFNQYNGGSCCCMPTSSCTTGTVTPSQSTGTVTTSQSTSSLPTPTPTPKPVKVPIRTSSTGKPDWMYTFKFLQVRTVCEPNVACNPPPNAMARYWECNFVGTCTALDYIYAISTAAKKRATGLVRYCSTKENKRYIQFEDQEVLFINGNKTEQTGIVGRLHSHCLVQTSLTTLFDLSTNDTTTFEGTYDGTLFGDLVLLGDTLVGVRGHQIYLMDSKPFSLKQWDTGTPVGNCSAYCYVGFFSSGIMFKVGSGSVNGVPYLTWRLQLYAQYI